VAFFFGMCGIFWGLSFATMLNTVGAPFLMSGRYAALISLMFMLVSTAAAIAVIAVLIDNIKRLVPYVVLDKDQKEEG